jgi:hypothetical protein
MHVVTRIDTASMTDQHLRLLGSAAAPDTSGKLSFVNLTRGRFDTAGRRRRAAPVAAAIVTCGASQYRHAEFGVPEVRFNMNGQNNRLRWMLWITVAVVALNAWAIERGFTLFF